MWCSISRSLGEKKRNFPGDACTGWKENPGNGIGSTVIWWGKSLGLSMTNSGITATNLLKLNLKWPYLYLKHAFSEKKYERKTAKL